MSMPINDGGPAFPQHLAFNSNGEAVTPGMYFAEGPGMTLRAYFAGQALLGLLSDPNNMSNAEVNAQGAVVSADALIAELAKGTGKLPKIDAAHLPTLLAAINKQLGK